MVSENKVSKHTTLCISILFDTDYGTTGTKFNGLEMPKDTTGQNKTRLTTIIKGRQDRQTTVESPPQDYLHYQANFSVIMYHRGEEPKFLAKDTLLKSTH